MWFTNPTKHISCLKVFSEKLKNNVKSANEKISEGLNECTRKKRHSTRKKREKGSMRRTITLVKKFWNWFYKLEYKHCAIQTVAHTNHTYTIGFAHHSSMYSLFAMYSIFAHIKICNVPYNFLRAKKEENDLLVDPVLFGRKSTQNCLHAEERTAKEKWCEETQTHRICDAHHKIYMNDIHWMYRK